MKNDYSFKLVAAIIFAGVIVALIGPSHSVASVDHTAHDAAPAAHTTE